MIRTALPEEGEKVLAFAQQAFAQKGEAPDLALLLPKMYRVPAAGAPHHLILAEDGVWQGLLLRRSSVLTVGGKALRVGHIGTVCTAPACRGQGVMKRLLERAVDDLAAQGCDLIALSGRRQRYERYDFLPAGIKTEFVVCAANVRGCALLGDELRPLESPQALEQAWAMFGHNELYMKREASAFADILASWGARAFAFYRQGEFAGYCTAFAQEGYLTVSELRLGSPELLGALCALLLRQAGGDLKLCLAPHAPEAGRAAALCERYAIGPDHNVRVLRFPAVAGALLNWSHSRRALPDGALRLAVEGYGAMELYVDGPCAGARLCPEGLGQIRLTYAQAVRLLFSPLCAERGSLAQTYPQAAAWLPLPLSLEQNDCY